MSLSFVFLTFPVPWIAKPLKANPQNLMASAGLTSSSTLLTLSFILLMKMICLVSSLLAIMPELIWTWRAWTSRESKKLWKWLKTWKPKGPQTYGMVSRMVLTLANHLFVMIKIHLLLYWVMVSLTNTHQKDSSRLFKSI